MDAPSIREFMDCVVCQDVYNETNRSPRILNCGHAVCTSCLNQLKASQNRHCPECRSAIPTCSTFPVSYTILRLLQSQTFQSQVNALVSQGDNKNKNKEILSRFLQDLFDRIDEKKTEINSWRSLLQSKMGKTEEYECKLLELEKNLKKVGPPTKRLNENEKEYECILKDSVFSLHDLETKLASIDATFSTAKPAALAAAISKKVDFAKMRANKNIRYFGCSQINGERRYAKITFGEKITFLHSLTKDPPPREAFLIDYQELKKHHKQMATDTSEDMPHIFLELVSERTSGKVLINLEKYLLSQQMALLCSGERFGSFKNSRVQHKNSHLLVDGYFRETGYKDSVDVMEGILDKCHESMRVERGMLLGTRAMNIGGTFTLITKTNFHIESMNIMGRVIAGLSLVQSFSYKGGFISDCGLVLDG